MKIIVCIKKGDEVRFISHLDVQRNLQRAVRRAEIPVAFSQGFSPHPLISFATALSVGQTGESEWIEIKLEQDMNLKDFTEQMNKCLPRGLSVVAAYKATDGVPAVANLMEEAEYTAYTDENVDRQIVEAAIKNMLGEPIVITKTKKQGGKKLMNAEVDIRPMLRAFNVITDKADESGTYIYIRGRLDVSGGLNADRLLKALNEKLGMDIQWHISRDHIKIRRFNYTDVYSISGFDGELNFI